LKAKSTLLAVNNLDDVKKLNNYSLKPTNDLQELSFFGVHVLTRMVIKLVRAETEAIFLNRLKRSGRVANHFFIHTCI